MSIMNQEEFYGVLENLAVLLYTLKIRKGPNHVSICIFLACALKKMDALYFLHP